MLYGLFFDTVDTQCCNESVRDLANQQVIYVYVHVCVQD